MAQIPTHAIVAINPGVILREKSAAEIVKQFLPTSLEPDVTCTYNEKHQAFRIGCGLQHSKTHCVVLPALVEKYLESQDQPELAEDIIHEDLAVFGVDTTRLEWEDHETEEADAWDVDASPEKPVEDNRVRETWVPDDERKDATSVLDVRNKGLVEEVGRRTDSVVEIDPERREVVVVADAHDTIVKALDMLKVLRRHLILLPQHVVSFMLEMTEPQRFQLRFTALNAANNRAAQSAIIDQQLRAITDLFSLRTVERNQPDLKSTTRVLIPASVFKLMSKDSPDTLSSTWQTFRYMARGNESLNPATWAPPVLRSLEENSVNANRVQQWVAEGAGQLARPVMPGAATGTSTSSRQNGQSVNAAGQPAQPGIVEDQKGRHKRPGKVRRPVTLNTHIAKEPSVDEPVKKGVGKKKKAPSTKAPSSEGSGKAMDKSLSDVTSPMVEAAPAAGLPNDYTDDLLQFLDALQEADTNTPSKSVHTSTAPGFNVIESRDLEKYPLLDLLDGGNDVAEELGKLSSPVLLPDPIRAPPLPTGSAGPVGVDDDDDDDGPKEPAEEEESYPAVVSRYCGPEEKDYKVQWPRSEDTTVPKKPHEAPDSFTNADNVYGALVKMLDLARLHNGQVAMQIKLGKILVRGLARQHTKAFFPGDWVQLFQEAFTDLPTFTDMLATLSQDADAIVGLQTEDGSPAFEVRPETTKVTYEFECLNRQGEEITIEIDGTSFEHNVRKSTRIMGSVYIYCPERSWDAQLCVTGKIAAPGYRGAIKSLLDNLYIGPNQKEASLATKLPPGELRIRSILVKRQSHHLALSPLTSPSSRSRIALQVTEVQDLIVQHHPTVRGALRAFAASPAEMMADPEGSRLWFEAEIVSLTVNDMLKHNETLGFLEEASWTKPDEVISAREFREMYRAALSVLGGMDGVGRRPAKEVDGKSTTAASQVPKVQRKKTEKENISSSSPKVVAVVGEKTGVGASGAATTITSRHTATPTEAGTNVTAKGKKVGGKMEFW